MSVVNEVREEVVSTVRRFVDREVMPVASELEHRNEYPHALVARMKELGLFGATIPQEYGGLGLDVTTYAMVVEELCRGWMSLSGVLNTHLMLAYMLRTHGTED
ncbi:MAG: acyl-CoA dehydrogenase family protein, partial [Candidatus Binatia bacterium]